MAKRFIDTDIWKKQFVKSLPRDYKLFWIYLMTDCNHAGIWETEFQIAEIRLGIKINKVKITDIFKTKIIEIDGGSKWFIPSFVLFQCGGLPDPNIRAHKSIIDILNGYGITVDELKKMENKDFINSLQTVIYIDKDKSTDIDKDKDKDKEHKKQNFTPPTEQEMIAFFLEKGFPESLAKKVFEYYSPKWIDSNGKKVLNWKQKCLAVWMKDENKDKSKTGALGIDLNEMSQHGQQTYKNAVEALGIKK